MYVLQCTEDTTGPWYRVTWGGNFLVSNQADDDLGTGTLTMEFADVNENPLLMPTAATFTQPIESQIVTLARGTLVRFKLAGATDPVCNVTLDNTEIQGPTLEIVV